MLTDEEVKALGELLDEPYKEYWAELGRFIHAFSIVEAALQLVVYHVAGVSAEIGRAIFFGLRVENAKDAISRILQTKGDVEMVAKLAPLFQQIGEIAAMRNRLVHWGARDTSDGLMVMNHHLAITPEKRQEFFVSAETLRAMQADTYNIYWQLFGITFDLKADPSKEPPEPWRYKPQARFPARSTPPPPASAQER
jgi:hypothetical protein